MKKISLFNLLLILYCSLHSQNKIGNSYIVKNNNDTLTGIIKEQSDFGYSKSVKFALLSEPAKFEIYYPNDIKEFGSKGNFIYKSFLIEIPGNNPVRELRFLKAIIIGYSSLFSLINSQDAYQMGYNETQFFIQFKNEEIYSLYKINKVENNMSKEDNRYKGFLKYKMQDCPEISKKIDGCNYNEKGLANLISYYNNFKEINNTEKTANIDLRKRQRTFGGEFYFGISSKTLTNIGYYKNKLPNAIYFIPLQSFSKEIGGAIWTERGIHSRLKLYLSFEQFSVKKKGNYVNPTNEKYDFIVDISFITPNLGTSYTYFYKFGKVEPFVEFALGFGGSNNGSSVIKEKLNFVKDYTDLDFNLSTNLLNYSFSIGIKKDYKIVDPYISFVYRDNHIFERENYLRSFGLNVGFLF